MLKLSHEAARLLNEAKAEAQVPDGYGLRVFAEPGVDGSNLAIAFAEGPEGDDQVSEQEGMPLFVARDVAEPLDDAVLDIEEGESGVSLVIKMEEAAGEMPEDDGAPESDADLPKNIQDALNS